MASTDRSRAAEDLKRILASFDAVGVAFSGGVDSSLLIAAAVDSLGRERVIALTAVSELVPERDRLGATEVATLLGVRHIAVRFPILENALVAANTPDRCYHCKKAVFSALLEEAKRQGVGALIHGANVDDAKDFRPGQKAADELGVRAPLREAGLGKAEIRALARARGLPNWDRPSMACLASRLPYGTPLTTEALRRVERAEEFLRERFGLRQVRVRDHMPVARIECEEADIPRLLEAGPRADVERALRDLGWRYVTLDLRGFRTGSMNEALP
jgi:uncharacterized protein